MQYAISAFHCFNKDVLRKNLDKIFVIAGRYRARSNPVLFDDAYCTRSPWNEQVNTYTALIETFWTIPTI